MPTGNKGEWSEFYAFLKLLADKKIFAADANLEKIPDKHFSVLKVIRGEAGIGKTTFDISGDDDKINIFNSENAQIAIIDTEPIKSKIAGIFQKIKSASNTTFSIPLAEEAMVELHCSQIKADCNQKSDLTLIMKDRIANIASELGFSVKSMLGSPSTLLNASNGTNFIYKIEGLSCSVEEINIIKTRSRVRDRITGIKENGGTISFKGLESESFSLNLRMIETVMPKIIAEMMLAFYEGKGRTLVELVDVLEDNSVFQNEHGLSRSDYEYKIKNFLVAVAMGMMPQTRWDGSNSANGGYIVVKEDGDIVCYHLYLMDEFKDYLYQNTKLETPSTGKHKFGLVYEEDGEKYIKLNLQIRFLK